MKGSVCFVLKLTLPPFSLPLWDVLSEVMGGEELEVEVR